MKLIALAVFTLISISTFCYAAIWVDSSSDIIIQTSLDADFDVTTNKVQLLLKDEGYSIAHVQHCDGGLKKMGYESDHYQVIFFGRLNEVRDISKKHEALIPYLPFKMAVYVEKGKTHLSLLNPQHMKALFKNDPELTNLIDQWEKEFKQIFTKM